MIDLQKLYELDEVAITKQLSSIQTKISLQMSKYLSRLEYEYINGSRVLKKTLFNLNMIQDISLNFENILAEAGYGKFLQTYQESQLAMLQAYNVDFLKDYPSYKILNPDTSYVKSIIKLDTQKLYDLSLDSMRTLKNELFSGAILRLSDTDIVLNLGQKLDLGMSNTQTLFTTSRNLLIQDTIDRHYEELTTTDPGAFLYEYFGPDDGKTRVICKQGLNKRYFTREEKQEFESKHGIRYNCRHNFVLISKDDIEGE